MRTGTENNWSDLILDSKSNGRDETKSAGSNMSGNCGTETNFRMTAQFTTATGLANILKNKAM
jgi:hypothetical protein